MLGDRMLILTLRIDGLLPHAVDGFLLDFQERAGEQRVGRAVCREHETDGFEILANDKRDAVLRGFEKQLAMNVGRETRDNNRGYVLDRKRPFAVRRFAGQLPIPATERALRGVNADDVEGHRPILRANLCSLRVLNLRRRSDSD